jgi:polar amino acid transport system substrate-binding protein
VQRHPAWRRIFSPGIRLLVLAAVAVLTPGVVPASAGDLAPTGRLRAVFLGTNPVQARVDPTTGEVTGPVVDLVRELARRLNVPFTMIPAPNAQGVIARVQDGTADLGFMAYEEARAREVDFAGPFAVMFNTYLVLAASPLRAVEDADREGVTIGAVRAQTQDLYLSAHVTRARIRRLDAQPSQVEMERLLSAKEVDAFAQNTQRAQEAVAAARVPLRALTGSYVAVEQSFVLKKGDPASVARVDALVEELKASGFIKAAIERAGLTSVGVAPPRARGK